MREHNRTRGGESAEVRGSEFTSIVDMTRHGGIGQEVSDDDGGGGDTEVVRPEKDTSIKRGAQPHHLFIFPLVLGVFICVLNILIAVRFWQSVWPNAVAVTLFATSLFIGLFLVAYGVVLWRYAGSRPNDETSDTPWHVKWAVVLPLLVALPAFAVSVWGAGTARPVAPKPQSVPQPACIELYREALEIKKDNPNFIMPWTNADQVRCGVNNVLSRTLSPQ